MPLELMEKPIHIQGWEKFIALGVPTKEVEAFRYVHLKELLSHPFYLPTQLHPAGEIKKNQLVFFNGSYLAELSSPPPQAIALPLTKAVKTYGNFLNLRLEKLLKEEKDPFAALNAAYYQEGLFLYLPPKTVCESPIHIFHILGPLQQPTLLSPRIPLFLGKESALHLSYLQTSSEPKAWINGYIDCALEERSSLTIGLLSEQRPESHDFLALRATLKKGSVFRSCSATNGGATSRHDYAIQLLGEGADASLQGVWSLRGERQHHVHVLMDHQSPSCTSLQKFKGCLYDSARSSFEGKIFVHQSAQKTQAYQMNNNLIVGSEASANCKPNLEIYADDVKASHGATIGQIEEEDLFYFTTRGISLEFARSLLIGGFIQEVIDGFEDPLLRQKAVETVL
jgi:Fe-S cluster assembly protein SufD